MIALFPRAPRRHPFLGGLALALCLAACAHRPVAPAADSRATSSVFYVDSRLFQTAEFPPPPAADSPGQKEDIAAVLDWQARRTEAECSKARANALVEYPALWGGKSPFPTPLPGQVTGFFGRVNADAAEAVTVMKERFRRPRPFVAYPEVLPCIRKSGGYSYPSGHAVFARMLADVLADIVPHRRDEFLRTADALALDRVIGGVHYPTDIEAGKLLGDEFHGRLLRSPAYRADIQTLKKLLAE